MCSPGYSGRAGDWPADIFIDLSKIEHPRSPNLGMLGPWT
jgi:hypothetical protein